MLRKAKKVVEVCLQSSQALQISLEFDEFYLTKNFKILISRRFEIFTKTSHLKLVGTPCTIILDCFSTHPGPGLGSHLRSSYSLAHCLNRSLRKLGLRNTLCGPQRQHSLVAPVRISMAMTIDTLFEIFIFVQKFNLSSRENIFFWWKPRENVVVLRFLAVDFTRKIVKKNLGEKLVKRLGFCQNWIFEQKIWLFEVC